MRITIRPILNPQGEIDLTERLVATIAEELWRLYGGNDHLNWIEAESHLREILGHAQVEVAGLTPLKEEIAPLRRARLAKGRDPHTRRTRHQVSESRLQRAHDQRRSERAGAVETTCP